MNQYERIRFLHEQDHLSVREIARMLHIARDTVSKYCKGETIPSQRKPGSGRKTVINSEINEFINACLEEDRQENLRKQKHTAKRIHDRVEEDLGIIIAESTIRKFVAEKREKIKESFIPLVYDPGEAVQIDWGSAKVYLQEERIDINFFCMRECSSDAPFCMAFIRQNQESFLEGIQSGLEFIGGSPRRIIFDNAKVGVKEGFGHYAVAQDRYAALAAHYAFKTVFCNPGEGHEKSLVEDLVGYARNNYMVPLPHVDSIKELNGILRKKCEQYISQHRVAHKEFSVAQMLEAARKCFIPLPPYRFDTSLTQNIQVDDFSLVRFDYNRYSVPFRLTGKYVTVKGTGLEVQIWYQSNQIAVYDRCFKRNNKYFRLEHYIELLERKPRSVWNAMPVRDTVPPALFRLLQTLEEPKQVLFILHAYLADKDKVMSILDRCRSYDEAHLELELPSPGKVDVQNEVKVSMPELVRYDVLLGRRAI
jgi:transposase